MAIVVAVIAVAITVPMMIVLAAAVFAIPITGVKSFPVMTRSYPARALVRRTGPIALMPPIAIADGVPVAVHPDKAGAGERRPNSDHPRRRRWTDPDSDSDLSATDR